MTTHKQLSSTYTTLLALGACALLASACKPNEPANATPAPSEASTPSIVLSLTDAPSNALSVATARAQAKPGSPIIVSGQIGGTLTPFVAGYAGFVLADPELQFCNEMGDDHCSTPWDACCEDPDKLKAMRVSVQIIDESGQPIEQDLKASLALNELDEVTVVGTVTESSTSSNVIIHARELYKTSD